MGANVRAMRAGTPNLSVKIRFRVTLVCIYVRMVLWKIRIWSMGACVHVMKVGGLEMIATRGHVTRICIVAVMARRQIPTHPMVVHVTPSCC